MRLGAISLLILCFMASCLSPDEMNLEEFKGYVADESNGLFKRVIKNGYTLDVAIQPTDLLIHREAKNSDITSSSLQRLRDKYAKSLYLVIDISKGGKEALRFQNLSTNYSQLVQTMSFGMSQHVELITSKGTIPPSDYIMDRTYGLSRSNNFLFVFDYSDLLDAEWFEVSLKEFGLGTGNQMFRFKHQDLKNLPRLQFPITNSSNHLNDF